jgi:nucleoside-diphosphate-sugar epimerase
MVLALTRRPQEPRDGVTWIPGALDDPASLAKLVEGSDAIIHVAGVINAADPAGYEVGNVTGTRHLIDAANAAGVRRFVHTSSLSAREPTISLYGASKARSEHLVQSSGLDWTIVRPPAVYGPGDRETLELFAMATRGMVFLPPGGRLSLIHVDDLCDLCLALASPDAPSTLIIEPDDGSPNGYSHVQFAHMLGRSVGKSVRTVSAPALLIRLAARIDRLLRGDRAKLTPDRASYFCHPDWVVSRTLAAPAALWKPRIPTPQGLAATAAWYREEGWLDG